MEAQRRPDARGDSRDESELVEAELLNELDEEKKNSEKTPKKIAVGENRENRENRERARIFTREQELKTELNNLTNRRSDYDAQWTNGNNYGEYYAPPTEIDAEISEVYAKIDNLREEYWLAFPDEKVKHDVEQTRLAEERARHYDKMHHERMERDYR